ncbi:FAD/NAD(P)-binding protein [Planotetraspora sp. GP83]|uniref:FAD/NAD(P)-binding protein n=1 Tax=Planotetraspora sp. GP83 TaxID=3156264 RepID=UPI00351770A3
MADSDFLPRQAYGRYLRHVLGTAQKDAWPVAELTLVTETVSAITSSGWNDPVRVCLSDGTGIDAEAVVLATGNAPTVACSTCSANGYARHWRIPRPTPERSTNSPLLLSLSTSRWPY